jgi:hypothetical protein
VAGYWIKFDTSTPDKPEVWAIAGQLDIDPDAVVGKLLRVWAWFDDHSENGNAPSVTKALLDRRVGVTGFCDAMISSGWMDQTDGEVFLPNFDRHNGATAKSRGLTAKRVANHKASNARGNAKGNAPSVSSALPRAEEKRREEKIDTKVSITGNFDEWYSAYPKKVAKEAAAKAYAKAIKSIDPDELLAASLPRLAELAKREPRYIPHPATWLNSGGWQDDLAAIAPAAKSAFGPGQDYDPNHDYESEIF